MPDSSVDVLIVGAGAAGAACAEALRERGFGGSVVLAGRDVDPPYERPYCSKDYLRGAVERAETYLPLPDGLDLRIRTSVMKLDTAARTAKLSSGEELTFGQAVLATGANVRRLRVDGGQLEGIHYLRTLGNSDAIRAEAAKGADVVLIGGSYIACEVAASLTELGCRCTLVMQEELPLSLGFGRTAGEFFAGVLREHGVEVVGGDGLERFEGDGERVRRVVTESGREVPADVVVMGCGAVPDVMLARARGAGAGGDGRHRVLVVARDVSRGRVGGGRRVRVRLGRAPPPAADRALGGRARPGRGRRGGDRRRPAAVRRGAVLLVRPRRLVHARVRRPGAEWDHEVVRGSVDDGEFTIFYLSADQVVGSADRRPLGRPRPRARADDLRSRRSTRTPTSRGRRGARTGACRRPARAAPAAGRAGASPVGAALDRAAGDQLAERGRDRRPAGADHPGQSAVWQLEVDEDAVRHDDDPSARRGTTATPAGGRRRASGARSPA